ncbi:MAG TPA: hypothetical protein VLJ68_12330 [Chitinophagaceae bacterium]|nr:hypothetical protein [Chitinophagaceae bacterium]
MSRYMKWIGVAAVAVMVFACFIPWLQIPSRQIEISGFHSAGTNYGKPGVFHLFMSFFFLVFSLTPRIWAKRANLGIVAINFAWAVRNYFALSACEAGECPEKKAGLYLMMIASLLMLVAALFPDMKLPEKKVEGG